MQVTVDQTSSIECNIKIVLPEDYTQGSTEKRVKEMAKTVSIDGFRKGKVPESLVRSRFGESIYFDAVKDAINETYQQAIIEHKVPVLSQPRIENLQADKGQEISFNAIVETYPDVEVGNLAELSVEQIEAEVTEQDIDTMIEQLREQQKHYHGVKRAAKEGDRVNVNFVGRANAKEFEGGSAENQEIILGSNSMLAGFEAGIVGMKAGTTKTVEVKFPDDYQAEHLKGVDAEFDIMLNEVAEAHLPEVDDNFMKQFDIETGMDDFRVKIKSNMEKNLQQVIQTRLQAAVADALVAAHEVEVPQTLLKEQIDSDKRKMFQQLGSGSGLEFDQLPDQPFADRAKHTVIAALLMRSVMEAENIEVDKDRLKAFIESEAAGYENPEQVVNFYYGDEQALEQVEAKVLEQQLVEVIATRMQVNKVSYSYSDAMQPPAKEADQTETEIEPTDN